MLGRRGMIKGIASMPFGQSKTEGFSNPLLSVFDAGKTIINRNGLVVYSQIPGKNAMIGSIAPAPFTDKFQNKVLSGITRYISNGSKAIQLDSQSGLLAVWHMTNSNIQQGAWTTDYGITMTDTTVTIGSLDVSIQKLFGFAGILEIANTVVMDANAFLKASDPNSSGTQESWHSLGTIAGSNCTVNAARYSLSPLNRLVVDISLTVAAGGSTGGTFTWTNSPLPSAYIPQGNYLRIYEMGYNAAPAAGVNNPILAIDGAATANPGRIRCTIPGGVAANVVFGITQEIPLD